MKTLNYAHNDKVCPLIYFPEVESKFCYSRLILKIV